CSRSAYARHLPSFPTRRSSDLELLAKVATDNLDLAVQLAELPDAVRGYGPVKERYLSHAESRKALLLEQLRTGSSFYDASQTGRSEEHTSELQSRENLVCRLLL